MLHLLKTALGAAILLAAYAIAFGLPFGHRATGAEVARMPAAGGIAAGADGQQRPGLRGLGSQEADGPTAMRLVDVAITPFSETLVAIGTSQARHSIVVTSEAAGQIVETHLEANRHVSEGDVLLRLASDLEEIEVSIAETELENARRTLDRYSSLNASSDGAVAELTVQDAATALARAEAGLARARLALDGLAIRAPISGVLGLSNLHVGGRLSSGDEIATIDDMSRIVVSFELPERAIGLLEVGRAVQAETPALPGRSFEAEITAFDSRIDETTRTITVQAEIDNVEGRLWPGMSFSVQVVSSSAPLPQVPASALNWASDGARVWAVRDGLATSVPVTIRTRQNDGVWIEGDLDADDLVVADGSARIREGAPVVGEEFQEARPTAGSPALGTTAPTGSAEAAGASSGSSGVSARAGESG